MKFDRMMSAITPVEFGLTASTRTMRIVLPMRSRTNPSTKLDPLRLGVKTTRRRSRSFVAFDRMTSAITPTEFGLIASTRTMRIVLPMRCQTNPSTKPDPLERGRQADGRSTVRWDELSVPVPSQGEPIRMPLDQTPDLFTPGRIRLPHRTKNF